MEVDEEATVEEVITIEAAVNEKATVEKAVITKVATNEAIATTIISIMDRVALEVAAKQALIE